MKLHEYQAKEIFRKYKIPVPPGEVASTPEEAREIVEKLRKPVMLKAQVHVGGRGKAGGIKLAQTPDQAFEVAEQILGMEIRGLKVKKVLVTEAVDIESEAYLGVIVDRRTRKPVVMVSAAGGIDIEEVARESPELIHKLVVNPKLGLLPFQARQLTFKIYESPGIALQASRVLVQLYRAFWESDASLAEINPFVVTPQGQVWALDAKIDIDDNGLYRQGEIAQMRDLEAEEPAEVEARQSDLTFIKLEGTVGCVVNGAGLAMSTMDLIKYYGQEPANFLDIGGSSSPEKVTAAMRILLSDPNVRAVLFNVFGGITRCDDVANGIVTALKAMDIQVPILVRLTGTNSEEGKRILMDAGLIAVDSMEEVVQKAVELSRSS